jgi:hypothetical protein
MDGIFLYTWRIFGLHDKTILQRFCATHKSSAHHSQAHHSHLDVHMIVALTHP